MPEGEEYCIGDIAVARFILLAAALAVSRSGLEIFIKQPQLQLYIHNSRRMRMHHAHVARMPAAMRLVLAHESYSDV